MYSHYFIFRMIFINTRPVDENAQCERRASKAHSHQEAHHEPTKIHMRRMVLCLLLFYLLVSIFPVLLHYPISLVSLFVPCIVLLYAICNMRTDTKSDQWPCCMVAIIGILLKIAAIAIYITVFPLRDNEKKASMLSVRQQARVDHNSKHFRMIFFVVLIALEVFIMLIGVCLKWHLVAFEKLENDAQKRRATLTSSRPLISEEASRRDSQA